MNHDLFEGGKKLPLVEDFYTIQGEGFHTGKAAYFIRIGGCDIGCNWCDAKYTWKPELHALIMTDDIVRRAESFPARAVVVTGGEPTLYPLDYLCGELKRRSVETYLETSGAYSLTGIWDWICLSPKRKSAPQYDIYEKANELKVIIHDHEDLVWAEENALLVKKECRLYMQPEWSRYETIIPVVVEYVKSNPQWNISLQAHKFMHIP